MTTLPPESADGQETGGQPSHNVPPVPPMTPGAPVPPVAPEQPAAPSQPQGQVPPQAPQHQVPPQAPQYQVPPQAPQYQVPPQAPQYQVPPQGGQGGYAAPPQGGYAQQPMVDPVSNITLNYWLSVFFSWIPALIFFLIEKDKGNPQARAYHADNLNFTLLRVGILFAGYILAALLAFVPVIGFLFSGILITAIWVVPIVFHIMAAVKAADAFRRGEKAPFIFNIPMVK